MYQALFIYNVSDITNILEKDKTKIHSKVNNVKR